MGLTNNHLKLLATRLKGAKFIYKDLDPLRRGLGVSSGGVGTNDKTPPRAGSKVSGENSSPPKRAFPPEIAGLMIRAYEIPLVSANKGSFFYISEGRTLVQGR